MHAAIVLLIACLVANSVHAIPSTKSRLRSSAPTATARSLVRGDNHDHHQYSNYHINNNNNHGPLQQRSSTAVHVVANGAAAGAEATIIWTALNSIATLLSTCGLGVYFSKVGLIDDNTLAVLSKLIFNIFQPAFLFSNVFKIVASVMAGTEKNIALCMLPAMAFVQLGFGMILGKTMTQLLYGGSSSEKAKELLACCTFSNSGPLPIVFAAGILSGHADPEFAKKAFAYISLYLLGWSPAFWIVGPAIFADESTEKKSMKEEMKIIRKRVLSPPVTASIVAMVLGSVPLFRNIIQKYLGPLTSAVGTLGTAYLPAVLLVLSGSLMASSGAGGGGATDAGRRTPSAAMAASENAEAKGFGIQILAIYIAKFVITPVVMFSGIGYLQKVSPMVNGWLMKDKVLWFVLLLESCMPSAQNLTVILQLQGKKDASSRLAKILLFIYVLGVPSICFWLIRILKTTGI